MNGMASNSGAKNGGARPAARIVLLIVIVAILLYIFDLILNKFILTPYSTTLIPYETSIFAVIVLVVGYAFITLLSRLITDLLTPRIGKSKTVPIKYAFSLAAYVALSFAVLGILKLNLEGLLVGSAFTGLVLGLASQTVLANFFAGLILVLARPVSAGERITFATWQYGVVAPSYPPKFYSNDFLVNGFTGIVEYVGFLYVSMVLDDGRGVKIPAGIFFQAMLLINSRAEKLKVRTKYEVEKTLDPDRTIEAVKTAVSALPRVLAGTVPDVRVSETTLNTYVLSVDVFSKELMEEPVRSDVLQTVMKTIAALRQDNKK